MCRYSSGQYKAKFVCFACRKCFHKTSWTDYLDQHQDDKRALDTVNPWRRGKWNDNRVAEYERLRTEVQQRYYNELSVCPDCTGQMNDLGHDFRPPPKRDKKAWAAVQKVTELGHRFHTCGCDGPGFIPSNPVEYRLYLAQQLARYRSSFDAAQACKDPEDRIHRSAHWQELINRIERAIVDAA